MTINIFKRIEFLIWRYEKCRCLISRKGKEEEMKEALIMLITEQLGAGNWDLLPTGDLYRIFNNLKDNQDRERTDHLGPQNPDPVKTFPTEDHP